MALPPAQQFVADGAIRIITARRQKELDQAVSTIGKSNPRACGRRVQARRSRQLMAIIEKAEEDLDIRFARGVANSQRLGEITAGGSDIHSIINVHGAMSACKKRCAPSRWRAPLEILMFSVVGSTGMENNRSIASPKAALRFRREPLYRSQERKIRFNVCPPGRLKTPVGESCWGVGRQTGGCSPPRCTGDGRPEEIANAVVVPRFGCRQLIQRELSSRRLRTGYVPMRRAEVGSVVEQGAQEHTR